MNRRQLLPMVAMPFLPFTSGCTPSQKATVRFRVIATVEVDGQKVEGSTVMEVAYSRVTGSAIGTGGASTLYGEAMILDLKGKGTVFVLPRQHTEDGSLSQLYEDGVLTSLGIDGGIGVISDENFEKLRNAKGRRPFFIGYRSRPTLLPAFVAFRDEKIPRTIYEVDPRNIGRSFPGVRFVSLDIEFTDAPVTKALKQRLPWLVSAFKDPGWDRDPPGKLRSDKDTPISHKIGYEAFFGNGSW
jgi:hypothetical protein